MALASRLAYRFYQSIWTGLDWLYPPSCGGCGKLGVRWCNECRQRVRLAKPPLCAYCGQVGVVKGICNRCQKDPPQYTALRSWAIYGGNLRNALHRLKYKHDIALGDLFARALVECYLELGWQADLIAPVPLGLARLNERGYNQAALLARPLALALALPYRPNAVKRVRETHSQVNLSTQERLANVHDAFGAQRNLVAGRAVLMVDDIATTGATLNSCASALVAAGARNVYALTVARTPLEPEARLE